MLQKLLKPSQAGSGSGNDITAHAGARKAADRAREALKDLDSAVDRASELDDEQDREERPSFCGCGW